VHGDGFRSAGYGLAKLLGQLDDVCHW
jgi:hypothetical protein